MIRDTVALAIMAVLKSLAVPTSLAVQPAPASVLPRCKALLDSWLRQRGLDQVLCYEEGGSHVHRAFTYDFQPMHRLIQEKSNWVVAFHGCWFYALWSILDTRVLHASRDKDVGHQFCKGYAGVYCSPTWDTARGVYATPHAVFDDGVYHRVVLELMVDRDAGRTKPVKKNGGKQWVFPVQAVQQGAHHSKRPPTAGGGTT